MTANVRRRTMAVLLIVGLLAGLAPVLAPRPVAAEGDGPPPTASVPDTAVLTPVGDTFVSADNPTTNYGGSDYFDTYGGYSSSCNPYSAPAYGLLEFDVSELPQGAQVTGARLQLTSRAGYAQNGDSNHHIIDLGDQTFDEDTVTWDTRPSDGTVSPGDPTLADESGGDVRTSSNNLGDSFVFRNTCGEDFAGDQTKNFPASGADQFDNALPYATTERHFVDAVGRAQTRDTRKLSLEVYNPDCKNCSDTGYWARYYSKDGEGGSPPLLIVTYTTGSVLQAVPNGPNTDVVSRVTGQPNRNYTMHFLGASSCPDGVLPATGVTNIGPVDVVTDNSGNVYSTEALPTTAPFIAMYITGPIDDEATEVSSCVRAGPDNDAWTRALNIPLSGSGSTVSGTSNGAIDTAGQSRWYKFDVQPGSTVKVTLSNLPADYDLALFRDISQTFSQLNNTQDLTRLSAEFAPSVFSPSVFSPSVFSPSVFSPDAYSPSVFSPSVFSPSVFSPSVFSPSVFSPSVFSPSVFSPSVFSPSVFSPSVFSPSVFSPSVFSPDGVAPSVFSPETFSSAQTRSLIGVSATPGTANESILADTWLATGSFYIRVSARDGSFDAQNPFTVSVLRDDLPACSGVSASAPASNPPQAGTYKTVILTDPGRMSNTITGNADADKATMAADLDTLKARPEVQGVVVDVGADPRVAALDVQADAHPGCPFAKNLVAAAIKDIVTAYRHANPTDTLQYVVLVGNDDAIPFFRYPDQGLLGPESDYVPPVADSSASQASLRLNYVLGQDEYGASTTLSLGDGSLPVPDLAVGRLVENASEISGVLDAYLGLGGGVVPTPTKSLVTGYDFLADAATSVRDDLAAGTGQPVDQLIAPNNISPQDPQAWTADQLRTKLLGSRHDITFLAGHFSANSALAADFSTSMLSTELDPSPVDMTNDIVFSAGCHSGYNIVDSDAIPGVTVPLDWAEAFASKKATLIAGTGYQYGDTDFEEYSERIYAGFAHQLRVGSGPVSVGDALMRSKNEYMRQTPDVRGLHRKALIESALFGLPMLSVNMPTGRVPAPTDSSDVGATSGYATNPGLTLGLTSTDLTITPNFERHDVPLTNIGGGTTNATYYSADNGVVTNPAEPTLPLVDKDVTVPGTVLRGVGFRGGTYGDETVVPLSGAATTELRGVHAPFTSTTFFPMRLATANYYDALGGGETHLLVTPAQHRVDNVGDIDATLRRYTTVDTRLFYSDRLDGPALSAAPSITGARGSVDGDDVVFRASAVGDPAAGIQSVWVTYTGDGPSRWTSLDLVQCVSTDTSPLPGDCTSEDSTMWVGRLAGAASVADPLRFIVQAVNGVGLVTLDDNLGSYYRVRAGGAAVAPTPLATTVTLNSPPASGQYGDTASVSATLTQGTTPLSNRTVLFGIGATTAVGTTDGSGVAHATVPLNAVSGNYDLVASFAAVDGFASSQTSSPFVVTKSPTQLSLATVPPVHGTGGVDLGLTATLLDANNGPLQRNVYFIVSNSSTTTIVPVQTDYLGRARLPALSLPAGTYTVTAQFLGTVPFSTGDVALTDTTYNGSSDSTNVDISDGMAPAITLSAPLDGGVYATGQPVTVSFSCADELGGSGLASCAGTQANATALDTSTTGTKTFTVTATDNAGNLATATATYRIVSSVFVKPDGTGGEQKAVPGTRLRVGVAVQATAGKHPPLTETFVGARATLGYSCVKGKPSTGTITVPISTVTYTIPLNSPAWVPLGDKSKPGSYQATMTMPNLCGAGKPIYVTTKGFNTGLTSDHPGTAVNIKWHAQIGTSPGDWSKVFKVLPS